MAKRGGSVEGASRVEGPKFELLMGGKAPLFNEALQLCDPETVIDPGIKGAQRVLDCIGKLRETSDAGRYFQGGLVSRLREDDLWKAIAPDKTFPEFCEEKIGLGYRSAMMLVQIHEKATELGFSPERLMRVGWTKAREFLRVATKETIESWIEKASRMGTPELKREIAVERAKSKSKGGEIKEEGVHIERVKLAVMVTHDERANIEAGIEQLAAELGQTADKPESRGKALDMLVSDWRSNHIDKKERQVEWHIANIARVYGVKLMVVPDQACPVCLKTFSEEALCDTCHEHSQPKDSCVGCAGDGPLTRGLQ